MDPKIIERTFGILAVILTITKFIPQIVKSFRTKSTRDLSWWSFAQGAVVSALWICFGFWRHSLELIIANVAGNISCLIILVQKYLVEKPRINIRQIFFSPRKLILTIFVCGLVIFWVMTAATQSLQLKKILGWITVLLNVSQLIPQAVKSFKSDSTKDLSWGTFVQIFTLTISWVVYGLWSGLYEVVVTNALVSFICGSILARKYFLEKIKKAAL